MAPRSTNLHDLPLEVLTHVCRHLGLCDLVRVSQSCKRFRHGGPETVELPTESPVVAVLRELDDFELVPRTRPHGCSESWVAYLARCSRQRHCVGAPPIAAGIWHSLLVDAAGRMLACGKGAAVGHGETTETESFPDPAPVAAMAGVRVRSVAAGYNHSLALGWDGRVYSWGRNEYGELGHGDRITRPAPTLVEGLEGVCSISATSEHSFAVTQSGAVFSWGTPFLPGLERSKLRPVIVEWFGLVRVRRVMVGAYEAFAIGETGELFSWGNGACGVLGHGDEQDQPSPKRVEALRGVRVCSVAVGSWHALALTEDGLVYTWGENRDRALLGNPHVEEEFLPKPIEALRGVRVGSVAAASSRSYAVSSTGELWAWGVDGGDDAPPRKPPLGHGDQRHYPLPLPIESLRDVKVDTVAVGICHTLARAEDGSVFTWGSHLPAIAGALSLGPGVSGAAMSFPMPQKIPGLRVGCGQADWDEQLPVSLWWWCIDEVRVQSEIGTPRSSRRARWWRGGCAARGRCSMLDGDDRAILVWGVFDVASGRAGSGHSECGAHGAVLRLLRRRRRARRRAEGALKRPWKQRKG